jgi:hypothetical protein
MTRGAELDGLSAASAVHSMLDFYRSVRADDVDLSESGDMLLFQWGTWDWGDGPTFQYDITRQFITAIDDPDDADSSFWQLSLTLHFEPSDVFAAVGSGDRWCNLPGEVEDFARFIADSAASTVAQQSTPSRVVLEFGPAG